MFSNALRDIAAAAEQKAAAGFARFDSIAQANTERVLAAFSRHRVSDACFAGTTGYGYDDTGRDKLELVYADVFGCESALVRTGFVNGSHAIACAIMACMRPNGTLLSATGAVYDTLHTLVGKRGAVFGSLPYYGMAYREVDMADGELDLNALEREAARDDVTAVFIQRSRGYSQRRTLGVKRIGEAVEVIRSVNPDAAILVDNCYGEFCETLEPTHVGADLICGSLIKNPGGGIAPAGGYIAGRGGLVARAAQQLTLPGIGGECGATLGVSRALFQGFFMAPHTVAQALKTAAFCAAAMQSLGYDVSPGPCDERGDIIQAINFAQPQAVLAFCRGIQAGAPVDSFAAPEPWDMPGYDCPVVMAAGAFVQGSSIELSCDAPMRPPYTAFMQGGLTFEAGKIGVMHAVQRILDMRREAEA